MALSLSNFLYPLLLFILPTLAKPLVLNFTVGWRSAKPDGHWRRVMVINNEWPIPTIKANVGDKITINLHNNLGIGNESTSLHFHGILMNGTPSMDGAAGVTQCAVPPGANITYEFTVRIFAA